MQVAHLEFLGKALPDATFGPSAGLVCMFMQPAHRCFNSLQEVLHSALYSEAIIRVQPMLTQLTSAHEAGHVAAAYLTGLPVATYTLGEL